MEDSKLFKGIKTLTQNITMNSALTIYTTASLLSSLCCTSQNLTLNALPKGIIFCLPLWVQQEGGCTVSLLPRVVTLIGQTTSPSKRLAWWELPLVFESKTVCGNTGDVALASVNTEDCDRRGLLWMWFLT